MFRQRPRLSHYLYFLRSLELRLQHGHWSSSLPGKMTESLSITNTKCVTSLFYDATSTSIHEAAENIALLTAMFKVSAKPQSNIFLYVLICAECADTEVCVYIQYIYSIYIYIYIYIYVKTCIIITNHWLHYQSLPLIQNTHAHPYTGSVILYCFIFETTKWIKHLIFGDLIS